MTMTVVEINTTIFIHHCKTFCQIFKAECLSYRQISEYKYHIKCQHEIKQRC